MSTTEARPNLDQGYAVVGAGDYRYRVDDDWARLPPGWWFNEIGAIGVDRQDNVYVFSRSDHPMTVFDRDGNFLRSWGEGIFVRPHGVFMGPDDTIYCTDDGDHTVKKLTLDGKLLMTIGTPGKAAPFMSGEPFHRCTHTACAPNGDIYVSDGYGNARVHKYTPDGRHILSWGSPGSQPGEFNIVHNICCDEDGWVYVADRENHRIQIFDGNGRYETQWNNMHRPSALLLKRCNGCPLCFVGENGPVMKVNRNVPNLGAAVRILDDKGKQIARLGATHPGVAPGEFLSPHGLAVDSRGDIYVGEVSRTAWPQHFPDKPIPDRLRCLTKLVKLDE